MRKLLPDTFENTCFITCMDTEGMIISRVKGGMNIHLEDAKENSVFVKELTGGKPAPMLVDCRKIQSITKEARDHFSMRGRKGYVNSIAILISSPVSKIIGNFFLGLNKPTVPTKLFSDEKKAKKWLNQYL